ncbi:MAG: ABC transporter ATP-binding protein, partial [Lachnospiraceae bacterium]|nr:ABC transporter ATP-binding protein [Lachnospiraceae bacterium]
MAAYEEQEYNKPFELKVWTRLFPFIRPYRKHLIITMSLNVVMALMDLAFPFFQSYAIDHFIVPKTTDGIGPFGILYVVLILLQGLCVYVSVHAASTIEMNIGRDMKRAEFEHLQRLSFSYYNTTAVGYIHARVMSDTNRISQLIAWGLTDLLWCSIYVVFVFVVMFALNWKMALIIAVIVPFVVILTNFFQNRMLGWNRKVRKINSQITGAYNEG